MSESGDYMDEMFATQLREREVELLLTGAPTHSDDLADLEAFVAALSAGDRPPRDVEQMATSLAAVARSTRPSTRRGFRRFATLAASGAIFVAMSGVAMAANGSSPGDLLYGVDRTLERIGIGDGGVDERISEFDVLISSGSDDRAFALLAEVIDSGDPDEAAKAEEHLVLAATKSSANAAEAQEKVAAILTFIEANRGHGIGVDGRDFGQGIAEIAKSNDNSANQSDSGANESPPDDQGSGGPPEDPGTQGNPAQRTDENPGKSSGETSSSQSNTQGNGNQPNLGNGQNTGSQGTTPDDGETVEPSEGEGEDTTGEVRDNGPPENAGPKEDKDPGPPDHAGPKDK